MKQCNLSKDLAQDKYKPTPTQLGQGFDDEDDQ